MCTGERTTNKIREEIDMGKFIDYVEDYFQLPPSDEQKGIRELYQDFNKGTNLGYDMMCGSVNSDQEEK